MIVAGVTVDRGGELLGDLAQRGGRSDRQAELGVDIAHDPAGVLQLGHVDVETHPVDALDLEDRMLGDDIANTAR